MKLISLTQGQSAIVDDVDFDELSRFKWYAHKDTTSHTFYACSDNAEGRFKMHRQIMHAPDGLEVDHIDGNGLNNVRSNLRLATHAQNKWNIGIRAHNKSGYTGVCFHKQAGRWWATINVNGRQISLGLFDEIEDAARARDAAALKYHGEFARLNFPKVAA
jgi:hypothetical protein